MTSNKNHYKGYSITKRGKSFWIRISHNNRIHNFTFHAPENFTESKQYAAAEKEAIRLRDYVKAGFTATIPTFDSYANYVIESKKKLNVKRSTISQYKYLLPRLLDEFGKDSLDQITPQRLNKFYIKLSKSETLAPASAVAIPGLLDQLIKKRDITYQYIHETGNVGVNTVSLAVHGAKVSASTAQKICSALDIDVRQYFYVISNSKPISSKTVREHITLLNTIFKMAVRERILDYNPVESSNVPPKKKSEVNYYQPEEISKIWDCLDKEDIKWQVIISLLIVTGCRRGEIAGLRWSSILWENNLLRINHEILYDEGGIYSEDSTKNMEEKYVQVDPQTMELLQKYKESFETDMRTLDIPCESWPEYCFYQVTDITKPIHPSSINQFLTRFSKKYEFKKINPHSLRHSLASALIADGVDIYAVSRQLGHKQVSTTREIYTHQINEHQAKIAERIPQIYNRPNKKEP